MRPLRFGHLNFLNAYPFYTALMRQKVASYAQLVSGNPAELNQMLQEGKLDVSLVSSYHYLSHQDQYDLLPGFCIAANGRVDSVTFHTKKPIDQLNGVKVALTKQSASSIQLLKILCHNFWHVRPEFVTLPSLEDATQFDAFLVIGDQALKRMQYAGYARIDLATAWHEKTSLPMVFALFAVRKAVMDLRGDEVIALATALDQSLKWGEGHIDDICQLAAEKSGLDPQLLANYYTLLIYRLGEAEWDGVRSFSALCDLQVPVLR